METDYTYIQATSSEVGLAFRNISNRLKDLSEEDIDLMAIEFFSDKNNIGATTEFVHRHPDCHYAEYIPKENNL